MREVLTQISPGHEMWVDIAYHGTRRCNAQSIGMMGPDTAHSVRGDKSQTKSRRTHIHMVASVNDQGRDQPGIRHGSDAVVEVNLRQLFDTGGTIYYSESGVYLTEGHSGAIPAVMINAIYAYDGFVLGERLFPMDTAPAGAVAAMLAVRAGGVRDVAASMMVDAGGDGEVPEEVVRQTASGLEASSDPSAGSSRAAPRRPHAHDISGDEGEGPPREVPSGVRVPNIPAWSGMVASLTRQFENLELLHEVDWVSAGRVKGSRSGEEFCLEGDGQPLAEKYEE